MQVMLADLIANFAIVLPCYARIITSGKALIWSNMGENFRSTPLLGELKIFIRIVHKKYLMQIRI